MMALTFDSTHLLRSKLVNLCKEIRGVITNDVFIDLYKDIRQLGSKDEICKECKELKSMMKDIRSSGGGKEVAKHAEVFMSFFYAVLKAYEKKDDTVYKDVVQRFHMVKLCKEIRGVITNDVFIDLYKDIRQLGSKDAICKECKELKSMMEDIRSSWGDEEVAKHAEVLMCFFDAVLKAYEKKDNPVYEDVVQRFHMVKLCKEIRGVIPNDVFSTLYKDITQLDSKDEICKKCKELKSMMEDIRSSWEDEEVAKHAKVFMSFFDAVLKAYENKDDPVYEDDVVQRFHDIYIGAMVESLYGLCTTDEAISEDIYIVLHEDIRQLGSIKDDIRQNVLTLIQEMEAVRRCWMIKGEKEKTSRVILLMFFLDAVLKAYEKKDNPVYEDVVQRFHMVKLCKEIRGVIPNDVFSKLYKDITQPGSKDEICKKCKELKSMIEDIRSSWEDEKVAKHAKVLMCFFDAVLKVYEEKDDPVYEDVVQCFHAIYIGAMVESLLGLCTTDEVISGCVFVALHEDIRQLGSIKDDIRQNVLKLRNAIEGVLIDRRPKREKKKTSKREKKKTSKREEKKTLCARQLMDFFDAVLEAYKKNPNPSNEDVARCFYNLRRVSSIFSGGQLKVEGIITSTVNLS